MGNSCCCESNTSELNSAQIEKFERSATTVIREEMRHSILDIEKEDSEIDT